MKKELRTWEIFDVNGISLGTVTAYSKYHARSEAISKLRHRDFEVKKLPLKDEESLDE